MSKALRGTLGPKSQTAKIGQLLRERGIVTKAFRCNRCELFESGETSLTLVPSGEVERTQVDALRELLDADEPLDLCRPCALSFVGWWVAVKPRRVARSVDERTCGFPIDVQGVSTEPLFCYRPVGHVGPHVEREGR